MIMKEHQIMIEKLKEENKNLIFMLSNYKIELQMWESFAHDYGFDKYGGIRYLTYNYSDAEWAEYTATHTLNYKG